MEVFVTTHMKKLEAEVHGGLKEERNRDKMGKDKRKHFQRSRWKANNKERTVMEERWLKK